MAKILQKNIQQEILIRRVNSSQDDSETDLDAPPTELEITRAKEALRKQKYRLAKRLRDPINDDAAALDRLGTLVQLRLTEIDFNDGIANKEFVSLSNSLKDFAQQYRLMVDQRLKLTDIEQLHTQVAELERQFRRSIGG